MSYSQYRGQKIKIENLQATDSEVIEKQIGVIEDIIENVNGSASFELIVHCRVGDIKNNVYVRDEKRLKEIILS